MLHLLSPSLPPLRGKNLNPSFPSITLPLKGKNLYPSLSSITLPLKGKFHSIPLPSSSLSTYNQTVDYLSHTLHINPQRALSLNPDLRSHSLDSLQFNHSLLLSINLSPSQISKLFTLNPALLTHPILPSFQFLTSIFHNSSLSLSVSRCPRLLLSPVETQLLPAVNFLKRLSVPIMPNTAILLVSDVELTLVPKVEYLKSLGFSYNEVKFMLRRSPRILTYSIEQNLKPKTVFLQNEMNLDVRKEIGRFPQYFSFNLENRIKRRYFLLKENRVEMGLEEMLRCSDGDFDQRILDRKLRVYQ